MTDRAFEQENAGGHARFGRATPRIDGRLKVTGGAHYPSDEPVENPAYAFLVTSAIARGRIERIDTAAAEAVPGVLHIMTADNCRDEVAPTQSMNEGGRSTTSVRPLETKQIFHDGQIVAVVVADSFEAAREAAHAVVVDYAEEPPTAGFGDPGAETVPLPADELPAVGDADRAFAAAPVRIDAGYSTPTQHHNPIELFTTTCHWQDGRLVVHEPSQSPYWLKAELARQLHLDPTEVQVVSRFVGGAFGSKGLATPRTALVAVAARRVGRPVKLAATRDQGFTIATYRAETRHHMKLGAGRDGRLQALVHEGWEITSRPDDYLVNGLKTTSRLYACPNVRTAVAMVRADRNTPGFMRSPPEVPYMFPLESAMDELAVALGMDPVELRRVNDTRTEPIKGLPWTSRALMPCFDRAAAAFGWERRDPRPGSMRDGDWLVGWGCATACYPTVVAAATARVRLTADGTAVVETAATDIGTGTYTIIAITAADALGLPVEAIRVEIGDSDLPPAPISGGSNVAASICNCVARACDELRLKLAVAAVQSNDSPLAGRDAGTVVLRDGALADGTLTDSSGASEPLSRAIGRLGGRTVEVRAETVPHGIAPEDVQKLYDGGSPMAGGASLDDRVQYAFGAEFVEVRIHERLREIRVPRMVGAFAAGRIVNPTTARNQLMGGMIWGMSAALLEATEVDRRAARYVNDNLADYLVPVNADVGEVEVIFVPEDDTAVNPLGIKGIGELGNVGTNAAVANAVWHATGIRIRDLPIRLEKLL